MYQIDEHDRVVELCDVPQQSIGAPCPIVVATDHTLVLCFYLQDTPSNWDGQSVRVVEPASSSEPCARIDFKAASAHYFGAPNDEAISGHPLYARGLHPYGVFEVLESSWLRTRIERNRVHPYHDDKNFRGLRHFIFSFHDRMFECLAHGYTVTQDTGSVLQLALDSPPLKP